MKAMQLWSSSTPTGSQRPHWDGTGDPVQQGQQWLLLTLTLKTQNHWIGLISAFFSRIWAAPPQWLLVQLAERPEHDPAEWALFGPLVLLLEDVAAWTGDSDSAENEVVFLYSSDV